MSNQATMMIIHSSSTPKTLLPKQPKKPRHHGNRRTIIISACNRSSSSSSSSSDSDWSSSVDESMVVLRERIQEIKAVERSYELPEDWAEWEKENHARYSAFVYSFAAVLQTILMSSRPSLGMAMIGMLAMSVPASAFTLAIALIHAANQTFSSFHF